MLSLTPLVIKLTNNYVERRINGKDIEPLLSYNPDIQKEYAPLVKEGEE